MPVCLSVCLMQQSHSPTCMYLCRGLPHSHLLQSPLLSMGLSWECRIFQIKFFSAKIGPHTHRLPGGWAWHIRLRYIRKIKITIFLNLSKLYPSPSSARCHPLASLLAPVLLSFMTSVSSHHRGREWGKGIGMGYLEQYTQVILMRSGFCSVCM